MKKFIIITLFPLFISCGHWSNLNKSLFATYTALNVIDICQTTYAYNSDKYIEANNIAVYDLSTKVWDSVPSAGNTPSGRRRP